MKKITSRSLCLAALVLCGSPAFAGSYTVKYYGVDGKPVQNSSAAASASEMNSLDTLINQVVTDKQATKPVIEHRPLSATKAAPAPQAAATAQTAAAPAAAPQTYGDLAKEDDWMVSVGRANKTYFDEVEKIIAQNTVKNQQQRAAVYGDLKQSASQGGRAGRNDYDAIIENAASKYGIPKGLIKAVMHTESSFNQYARSPVGAQGLMQLMPATARRFNVENSYDPEQNIDAGAKYLSWLIKRFNGDVRLALAGYNAGEGNVDKYKGIPPFKETQNYVKKVLERYNTLYKYI